MKKSIIIVVVIVGALVAMGVVLAGNKKKIDEKNQPVDRSKVPVTVSVAEAKMGEFKGGMSFSGLVEAGSDADISVSSPGIIRSLNLSKGQFLRKGQVIGTIDTEQMKLQLKSLELAEAKLKTDLERVNALVAGNAAPETNLKDLEFNLENTKIQIEQLKQRMTDCNIVAPINGTVILKNMEAGEFANPGMLVGKMVDMTGLKIAVFVNEKHIYRIQDKQKAIISTDALPGQNFSGAVSYIAPIGDENHNYRVEVALDAEASRILKAGTYMSVDLGTTDAGQGLMVPASALVTNTGSPTVFIVNGQNVKSVAVTTGRREGDNVEILSGLKAGDKVVTAGQINLTDGALIAISNN